MNRKVKIFNDPVYGFISIPYGILFDLIEHPYFQRLRRIKQVGLTHYVYPGALHTRFHHALGALHLTQRAIQVLRQKETNISHEEEEATCIAILLHDIGHGPFSHALEHSLVNVNHEQMSSLIMHALNEEFDHRLDMALAIFRDEYPKSFLHQLVSSQLDMDRMDYLSRDSFYTGVSEGVISYERLLKMLTVIDGDLAVEEKGIYSVEKFLIARRLMYWQVYLHKTALSAEQMLIKTLERMKALAHAGVSLPVSDPLAFFLYNKLSYQQLMAAPDQLLRYFVRIDDVDIWAALKAMTDIDDRVLAYLSKCLINRQLFRVVMQSNNFSGDPHSYFIQETSKMFDISEEEAQFLVLYGQESNIAYKAQEDEIKILTKSNQVVPISQMTEHNISYKRLVKYYIGGDKSLPLWNKWVFTS